MSAMGIVRRMMAIAACVALWSAGARAAPSDGAALDALIGKLENAITTASRLRDEGKISPGNPYRVQITPKTTLSFGAEHFEADAERAFTVYKNLLEFRAKGAAIKSKPAAQTDSRLDALMEAERKTAARAPLPPPQAVETQFDLYQQYRAEHDKKAAQEEQAAEADMRAVSAERKSAEVEQAQRRQRDQALQQQAMKWQAELDKQASHTARAAAQWEEQHSFGAYAKRFLAAVLQTTIGSFTTAFLTPITTDLANRAVQQMFPDAATGGLAAQAGAAGQAVSQGAADAVTGPPAGTTYDAPNF
ncbi:MAG: hypothetical protein HY804_03960 [Nitrospinae bacterium]|nr:hypothetical protein [Nitrospinota bacterium]